MLNEKQIVALEYLALPKRGGLTYEQIAEQVGTSSRTLQRWRNNPEFTEALKQRVVATTLDKLPEVLESLPEIALKDRNAAMMKLYLQVHGLLSDNVNLQHKTVANEPGVVDISAIRQRLAERGLANKDA